MASGESQGKSVALIVFVSLTAITGVSAYYFFDKVKRLELTQQAAAENQKQHDAARKALEQQHGDLAERVLGDRERAHDEVMTAVKADLESPKVNQTRLQAKPAYESYADALDYLTAELNFSDGRKLALLENIDQLQKQLAALEQRYQLEVDEAARAKDTKEQELADQRKKLQDLIALKDEEINNYLRKFGEARTQAEQVRQNMEREAVELNRDIARTRTLIEDRSRSEQLRGQLQFELPDGVIVQTIPSLGQAYIDLGFEDKLFPGLTFSVYDASEGGSPYRLPKANIEVVRVGPRRSLAKVTSENNLHPVIAGDLIYNPVWSKDRSESVAFVGRMYVDDDEIPDNDYFASLVRQAGGKIDAFVPDERTGRIDGELTVNTGWLVVGEIPEASRSQYNQELTQINDALTQATSKLRRDAQSNGVRVINVRNFLTFMGLETQQRTVVAGTEEKFYYGKPRPRLVDEVPRPAVEQSTNN